MQLKDIQVDETKDTLNECFGMTSEEWKVFEGKYNKFITDKATEISENTEAASVSITKAHIGKKALELFTPKEFLIITTFHLLEDLEDRLRMIFASKLFTGAIESNNPLQGEGGNA